MPDQLTFHPYARSDLFEKVTSIDGGRAVATINVTLRDELSADSRTAPLMLHLMGPADAAGLQPSAIVRTAPKPWTRDAESTKLAHIDFGEIDLPWRYSFELRADNNADRPKPWIVLLTGTTDEIELAGGGVKIKSDAVLVAHDLTHSWMWAHEMEDVGRKISRLISPRGLENNKAGLVPNHEYIAAVVPAYAVVGGQVVPAWEVQGGAVVRRPDGNVLPAYYAWNYWTADAGDFETLAALLHAVDVRGLGRANVGYQRLQPPPELEVRGAITSLAPDKLTAVAPIHAVDTTWPIATKPAPDAVLADFDALNAEVTNPRGPVVGLPTYGIPWIAEPKETDWGRLLNGDPRFRGLAGLGAWLAMEAQDELVDAARQQVGALAEASQRVRQVSMGLRAARALWSHRLSDDPVQQLVVFGPSLLRLPASNGAVDGLSAMDMVTGGRHALPRAALSTAARRLLRPGDGIAKHAQPGAAGRHALLEAVNECSPLPAHSTGHVDNLLGDVGVRPLGDLLGVVVMPDQVRAAIEQIVAAGQPINSNAAAELLFNALQQSLGVPFQVFNVLRQRLAPYDATMVTTGILTEVVRPFLAQLRDLGQGHEDDLSLAVGVLDKMGPLERPCQTVDLVGLGRLVADAISPMGALPPVLVRICASVTGIDICNLEPPEVCIGLNYEVWKLLRDKAKSWLLPGIEDLEKNAVVAMESNPAFVDALLVGMNTQLLAELRWHNLAIAPKCTPLRWFWGNYDYKTNTRTDDIHGIDQWQDTRLGDNQHQVLSPGDPAGNRDLVMVFRTDLFRRYPSTVVYLTKMNDPDALQLAPPDFAGRRAIAPRIKGTIGDDVTFFIFDIDPSTLKDYFVVLDEPPAELRFRSDHAVDGIDSADFAVHAIDVPIRVAIDGTYLDWKGLPVPV